MKIDKGAFPFPLSAAFTAILEAESFKAGRPEDTDIILNFRDPHYCPEDGGYHPVEICINYQGKIQYITDFAYVGQPPFAELVKEIDFDVSVDLLQHFGWEHSLEQGRELFELWQQNFVSYCQAEIFTVTASHL